MASAHAADDLTRPIRVSPDGHFLAQSDGQPFFWLGDTGWLIFTRLTREEADVYLRDRAEKGFTVVQAVVMGLDPPKELDAPNRYGELALIERDPLRPNPKYFEHVDWVVDRARHYGLRIAMLPAWGGSLVAGLQTDRSLFTPATARVYGEWIGKRCRGKGIIWVLGGDTNPVWQEGFNFLAGLRDPNAILPIPVLTDYRPIYDAMARGIIDGENDDPFLTYHPNPVSYSGSSRPLTSLFFGDRPWLDMNMLQSSHYAGPAIEVFPWLGCNYSFIGPRNYEYVREEYDSKPTRPVVDGEPRYERLPRNLRPDHSEGLWNSYDARNAAYHAVFAGAAGHTFGNGPTAGFYDPAREPEKAQAESNPYKAGWHQEIHSEGARTMQYLKSLMLSRPYFTRIPDQTIVVGATGEGTAHIGATRDKAGSYAMIFLPHGQPVAIDMSKISGARALGWWFDPRTGIATPLKGTLRTAGVRTFTPPESGVERDWVLVLDDERSRFPAPGLRTGG